MTALPPNTGTLGRGAIIKRLQKGDLSDSPLLSEEQIGATSIDLRMGYVVLIVRARGAPHVDPAEAMRQAKAGAHQKESGDQQKHERYELPLQARFLLH